MKIRFIKQDSNPMPSHGYDYIIYKFSDTNNFMFIKHRKEQPSTWLYNQEEIFQFVYELNKEDETL